MNCVTNVYGQYYCFDHATGRSRNALSYVQDDKEEILKNDTFMSKDSLLSQVRNTAELLASAKLYKDEAGVQAAAEQLRSLSTSLGRTNSDETLQALLQGAAQVEHRISPNDTVEDNE